VGARVTAIPGAPRTPGPARLPDGLPSEGLRDRQRENAPPDAPSWCCILGPSEDLCPLTCCYRCCSYCCCVVVYVLAAGHIGYLCSADGSLKVTFSLLGSGQDVLVVNRFSQPLNALYKRHGGFFDRQAVAGGGWRIPILSYKVQHHVYLPHSCAGADVGAFSSPYHSLPAQTQDAWCSHLRRLNAHTGCPGRIRDPAVAKDSG